MIKFDIPQICKYLLEAPLEVFSLNNDNYPPIGTQPFSDEIYTDKGARI